MLIKEVASGASMKKNTRRPQMYNQQNYFRIKPFQFDLFCGMDVDKKSISLTFVSHEGFVKSLKIPHDSGNLIQYVRRRFADFEGVPLSEIRGAHIEEYKAQRLDEGAAIGTINREISVLSSGYTLAMEQELIAYAPSAKQEPEQNIRTQTFTESEFATFCTYLPADVLAAVLFQWETGWRSPSETLTLTWAQVDFQEEIVLNAIPPKVGNRACFHLLQHSVTFCTNREQLWINYSRNAG
jgi:integrase